MIDQYHTGLWLRTGCVKNAQVSFLDAQVSKKNGRYQTIIAGKKLFLRLFYCYSVNLNAVSCLTEDVIHHRFRRNSIVNENALNSEGSLMHYKGGPSNYLFQLFLTL